MKTIKIKELNIEVEAEIHDNGKSLPDIKIPKGWRLLTMNEIRYCHSNYRERLALNHTWEFIEQPFDSLKGSKTAWFYAGSFGIDFVCFWNPLVSVASLGVRFCRKL